jgi:hypothetical protein
MINFSSNVYSRLTAGLSFGLLIFSGCSSHENDNAPITTSVPATDDVHVHPTEGPHHGGLIELGNEEYHIEIVHDDDAGTVTAYILDSSAKLSVPISATQINVNLSHDGQAEQFALAVNPQSSDPPGKSSRFASSEGELVEDLDNDAVAAQIVVEINGKQYRGAIQHGHESDGGSEHGHN